MVKSSLFLFLLLMSSSIFSQKDSTRLVYKTSFITDGSIITAGIGLTVLGVKLINNKKSLNPAELANKTKDQVFFLDRSSVGNYSKRADDDSYIPFQASFAMPVIIGLLNKNERKKFGQIMVLYTETMAITGTLFTMSAGNINRSRPYVYNTGLDTATRIDKNAQRAFFAGHTAATAAATFFMAKVFNDLNPGSKAVPYVWAFASAVPALVGYLRYKAGMHFLTDNLLGYAVGAGAGILVPQLHKIRPLRNVSFIPYGGVSAKGLSLVYNIR